MRGLFVLYHALSMGHGGGHCRCKKRSSLLQCDSMVFAGFLCLILPFIISDIVWTFAWSGCMHWTALMVVLVNLCHGEQTKSGGCNALSVSGTLLIVFYSADMVLLFAFALNLSLHDGLYVEPDIFGMDWFCWSLGIAVFATFQLWTLLRMMQPVFVALFCCFRCKQVQRDRAMDTHCN